MARNHSDMIILLATGVSQRRMYFDGHPKVQTTAREAAATLNSLECGPDGACFSLGVYNNKFVKDGSYLVGPSIAGRSLIDFAERLGCGGMAFHPPLENAHLESFFRLGAERLDPPANLAEAQALFDQAGIAGIRLLPPMGEKDGSEKEEGREKPQEKDSSTALEDTVAMEFAPLLRVYQSMYDAVAGNAVTSPRDGHVDLDQTREIGRHFVEVSDHGAIDVMQFLRYPDYDSYTVGHSVRVAALSVMLGRRLGWPDEKLKKLATAGLLHDLGKGCIPEEILFKNGALDKNERRIMESHPAQGVQVLLNHGETDPFVISAVWGHHLRHDGGGYPSMKSLGHRPGAVAELVHLCDVFEALTAHRPYKKPMTTRRAYQIMLKDEGSFHPTMLATFIRTLGLYPPGTEVHLSDGSTGVVVAAGQEFDRPRIRVIADGQGVDINPADQPTVDLGEVRRLKVVAMVSVGFESQDLVGV